MLGRRREHGRLRLPGLRHADAVFGAGGADAPGGALRRAAAGADSARAARCASGGDRGRADRGRRTRRIPSARRSGRSARGRVAAAVGAAPRAPVGRRAAVTTAPSGCHRWGRSVGSAGHVDDDHRGVHQLRRLRARVPEHGDLRGRRGVGEQRRVAPRASRRTSTTSFPRSAPSASASSIRSNAPPCVRSIAAYPNPDDPETEEQLIAKAPVDPSRSDVRGRLPVAISQEVDAATARGLRRLPLPACVSFSIWAALRAGLSAHPARGEDNGKDSRRHRGGGQLREQPAAGHRVLPRPATDEPIGLMHYDLGGYRPGDIEVVCAFDIDRRKVGATLDVAALAPPNNARTLVAKLPRSSVVVEMGPVLDGVSEHMADYPEERRSWSPSAARSTSPRCCGGAAPRCWSATCPSAASRPPSTTRAPASRPASRSSTASRCSSPPTRSGPREFERRGIPIVGDDIKSQLGATIVHRTLAKLFADRGIELDRTYQLNTGGNTDFLNMLNRERARRRRGISKTEAVQSVLPQPLAAREDPHRPERLRAVAEGQQGLLPAHGGTRASATCRSSSSCASRSRTARTPRACVIDAIRCCRVARDRGVGGPLVSLSSYLMKHPPQQLPDDRGARRRRALPARRAGAIVSRGVVDCRPVTAAAAALVIVVTIVAVVARARAHRGGGRLRRNPAGR